MTGFTYEIEVLLGQHPAQHPYSVYVRKHKHGVPERPELLATYEGKNLDTAMEKAQGAIARDAGTPVLLRARSRRASGEDA